MKRQSGFTLIELIIVIVILGILAVTAAPQFFNFGSDARESTVRGLEGSVKAASELVHARAQINPNATSSVEVRGEDEALLLKQYAAPRAGGIDNALSLSGNDWIIVTAENVANDDTIAWRPASINEGDAWALEVDKLDDARGCFAFYYWDPEKNNAPVIGSVLEDC